MGIKLLNKFLKKHCREELYRKIDLSEYAYRKIAIDISIYICKFKAVAGDRWLESFVYMVAKLRANNVHFIFVYDGASPIEKTREREKRVDHKNKLKERIARIETAILGFHDTGVVDPCIREIYDREMKKSFLTEILIAIDRFDISVVEEKFAKIKNYVIDISQDDYRLTMDLFDILDVPYYRASSEAETSCAAMCLSGMVDAVLSEDTDVLAYGTPRFLSHLDIRTGECIEIEHSLILSETGLSRNQFIDFCIMCGTDYNPNIKLVGPEKAFKLVTEFKSIEGVGENTAHDVSVLQHVSSRRIFSSSTPESLNIISIPFCGTPDFKRLEIFLFQNNIMFPIAQIRSAFTTNDDIKYC